ncbi:hypothetical protein [Microbacterium sp. NPDC089696]
MSVTLQHPERITRIGHGNDVTTYLLASELIITVPTGAHITWEEQ